MAELSPAPIASVVVVSRDLPPVLAEALDSLRAQSLRDLETIVVLNRAAEPVPGAAWASAFDGSRLIVAGRNLGFAGGANLGIGAARGRYVLLLNDDARAEPGWAEALVAEAERSPGVGMCASKVLLIDPAGRIDTTGHRLFVDGLNRGRGRFEIDRGQYDGVRDVLFPSGAAALYRRAMLDELGGFDERFFAYGEDTDLGLRARLAGWGCRYVPDAVAFHHGSVTAGAYSSFKAFHVERNRVWLVAKHFPAGLVLLNPAFSAVRYGAQAFAALRGRGAAARFRAESSLGHALFTTLRALAAGWLGVPRMLAERRRLRSTRRLPLRTIYAWLRTDGLTLRQIAWTE